MLMTYPMCFAMKWRRVNISSVTAQWLLLRGLNTCLNIDIGHFLEVVLNYGKQKNKVVNMVHPCQGLCAFEK
jgi:hypothetical protein